jgi:hypothetical protein
VLYPLLAVAQGCGLAWLCAWLWPRLPARPWARLLRAGLLLLVAVAGVLYLGGTLRAGLAAKNKAETRTQAIHAVNTLAHELGLKGATVGIASELQIHPLDLRQLDKELLYRLEPAADLICHPGQHDLLVLPSNDGSALVRQAADRLTQEGVPHAELGEGALLQPQAPIVEPGVLVAAPPPGYEGPDGCAPGTSSERETWPPAPLAIGDWEAPIPDRHRPDETPAKPWRVTPACAEAEDWRIVQEQTATYSRLQERGARLQMAVRGSVQTAPCTLAPGAYRLRWQARSEGADRTHALLQVTVWEHPPGLEPRKIRTRVLRVGPSWAQHYELVRVTRSMPLSLELEWIDGPGAPQLDEGQPEIALTLQSQVRLQTEPTPSVGKTIVAAWENTLDRLLGREQ